MLVERYLAKVEAAGSSPASRSNFRSPIILVGDSCFGLHWTNLKSV